MLSQQFTQLNVTVFWVSVCCCRKLLMFFVNVHGCCTKGMGSQGREGEDSMQGGEKDEREGKDSEEKGDEGCGREWGR